MKRLCLIIMASIRNIANCIGLSGNISIRKDSSGYAIRLSKSIALLNQVQLLKGRHIDLNPIHVAFDLLSFGNTIVSDRDIGAVVQIARETFAKVKLGIGHIRPISFVKVKEGVAKLLRAMLKQLQGFLRELFRTGICI
jgi:hypothetical protein